MLDAREGFEPSFLSSEPSVLPLNYPAKFGAPGRSRTYIPKAQGLSLLRLPVSPQEHIGEPVGNRTP